MSVDVITEDIFVNVDFWFCNDDFCKKTEGKKVIFVIFPWR